MLLLADVSRNRSPSSSANSCPCCSEMTCVWHHQKLSESSVTLALSSHPLPFGRMAPGGERTKGLKRRHTFLSLQSHLLPMRILLTPSDACCSTLACHVRMSERGWDIGCQH